MTWILIKIWRYPEIFNPLIYKNGNWGPVSLINLAKSIHLVTNSELECSFPDSQEVLHLIYLSFKIPITNHLRQNEKYIFLHTHILCMIKNMHIIRAYIWLYLISPLLSYRGFYNYILKQTFRVKHLSIILQYQRALETQA